ncbi:ATP-binding protein [Mucilaginibacter agri]|uniref:ATP-binding protein n=1 Tax=Mucilaginibacter agri TaxID=2695265 RepID=UPI001FB69707|nr:ATP-binding protein [Mucilaginibacter agri]
MHCCFAYGSNLNQDRIPTATNGVLDLRNQTFGKSVAINGQWLFYWRQLIYPQDTTNHKGSLVEFPFKWNSAELNGKKLPAFGYATYKVTVLLPRSAEVLRLAVPDMYTSYRFYVNGKLAAENGTVDTTAAGSVPYWQYHSVDIQPGTDTLKLILQVSNFVHAQGGINKEIIIGNKWIVELARRRSEAIDLLLTGCLMMGGIFFLGLYLRGNRDKAILLFSLFCLVYAYRVIGTDNYVLHTLIPNINWYITTRAEYMSLFTGIALFGWYTRYLYPMDVNAKIVNVIGGTSILFALAALVLPAIYFTQLLNPFLVVMLYCLVYIPYVYWVAYKNKRPGALYALQSALALMIVFGISLFHYWGVIAQWQLISFFCYISFFFLQSLVLSHRVSFALTNARRQAEQGLRVKSEFLSTMSHEIRTPLNSVIGMSHLLLKNDPRPDQIEQLDVMLFSANNLLAIVNDILDYNKIEAGKITFEHIDMDVSGILQNIVTGMKTVAQDKGIDLTIYVDAALGNKVLGDPTRLSQVITNLVHNAIKFTQKGYVQVSVEVNEQTDTSITLTLKVKDTGIGIPADKHDLIFERFTQADSSTSRGFGGTGLGLAICKRILELQGSSLKLHSVEAKGSIFYFTQVFEKSIKTAKQKNQSTLPGEETKPLNGIDILLVEDNPMNVLVAQTYLKRWGASIDVATNGVEALSKLDIDRHKLILMDLHMPVMDGYQASKEIRASGVTIPIVALTANLLKEIEDQVKQCGIDDIVTKPFLPDELYRKVLHYVFKQE